MSEEFMTLWDYIPDPGPAVRDPMWRQHALREFTRRVEQPQSAQVPFTAEEQVAPDPDEAVLVSERSTAKGGGRAKSPSARLRDLIDDAGVGRRRPRDVAIVEAAIRRSLDDGLPTFVDEILSARRSPDGLVARVRIFDGGIVLLTVAGGPEPTVREWEAEGDQRAFHYLDGGWARFDEAAAG